MACLSPSLRIDCLSFNAELDIISTYPLKLIILESRQSFNVQEYDVNSILYTRIKVIEKLAIKVKDHVQFGS